MARGGYRPGSGPAKGTKYSPRGTRASAKKGKIPDDIVESAAAANLTPLEYMLKVMNDPDEDKDLRARMAVSAAPYMHPRKGEGVGKKDEKAERAKAVGGGMYASMSNRLKVVK